MKRSVALLRRYLTPLSLVVLVACGWMPSARADIAVIVHPQNPLTTLDESVVKRIYMGRMRMFPGSSMGVETVDQPESAERFVAFYHSLMALTPAKLKRQRASYLFSGKGRLPLVKDDDAAVKAFVAETPSAIGYIQAERVDASVRVVATVKTQ